MKRTSTSLVAFAAAVLVAPLAAAQPATPTEPALGPQRVDAPPPPPPEVVDKPCPANGYAPPAFGVFADNDQSYRAYEIASPCIGPDVRAITEAVGMGRNRPLGVKNVSTIRFQATGRIADERGRMIDAKAVDVAVHYGIPAMRIVIDGQMDGAPAHEVRVFSDGSAWDETAPGIGAHTVAGALGQRAPLVKLTPFGGVWSAVEAEGHAVVTKSGTALKVDAVSPYDGYKVKLTTDARRLPARVEVKAEGATYVATFEGWSDKWESAYLVLFPSHVTWSKNGKPIADLTVTAFHSNPYVAFPAPEPAAAAGKIAAPAGGER